MASGTTGPIPEQQGRRRRRGPGLRILKLSSWGFVVAIVLLLTACATSASRGADAVDTYFAAWTDAWASGDQYATIRFYDDSAVMFAQPDAALWLPAGSAGPVTIGEGRSWLAAWIPSQTWHDREIADVFVFRDGAAVVHTIEEQSTASLTLLALDDSKIILQSVLRWRSARPVGTDAEDPRLAWVEDVVDRHLQAWSSGDRTRITELYTDDAVIDLHDTMSELTLDVVLASGAGMLPGATVGEITAGDHVGDAVFVVPSPTSDYIVFVADTQTKGCSGSSVVVLEMKDGLIVTEDRAPSLDTIRDCSPEFFTTHRWWVDLDVPPPVQEQISGEVALADGSTIDVINGSAPMEKLLTWGLSRYSEAGMEVPLVGSVTFAPVPTCENRDGIVLENDSAPPDLVICTNQSEACDPSPDDCTGFKKQPRLSLLHELAHVWLLAAADEPTKSAFMSFMGSSSWRSSKTPWHERGVEQAAEIIAWALMDEPIPLGRIGDPPCDVLQEGFTLLTGRHPLNECQ